MNNFRRTSGIAIHPSRVQPFPSALRSEGSRDRRHVSNRTLRVGRGRRRLLGPHVRVNRGHPQTDVDNYDAPRRALGRFPRDHILHCQGTQRVDTDAKENEGQ